MWRKWIVLFFGLLALFFGWELWQKDDSAVNNRLEAKVIDVVDGDTMKVIVNNKKETIRLLLVDTPESVHPTKPVQPFAIEASNFAKEMLSDKKVELELGVRERDKYGRLLVYLYINGQMFNEMLLENGLARVAYVHQPNTKYVDRFLDVQKKAQQKEIGIWSIENYVTNDGFNDKIGQDDKKEGCDIKGNINSKGEKIYHMPGSRHYYITKPEMMFCTEEEAKEAGFRKAE
ncbi:MULTISPECIES: thermonuclease family protein [Aeribacillus]|uniref:Thermonuclease family protein n=1 Tax=Aeribacillus composti TaxID=1868734 RepID=A0ABY9WE26_9BACI|nr:thermonuclease family protein [Aeribacillus composti]MED0702616.1 thermonuclease family protein [Aeribacillus composti]MED1439226.1 thermonuclease family protein [Aeribacillus composti]REJ22313.1 MAG: nuclease [Bacillaceae bacterium]WNF34399.1 thermonuclease family protein [Aeribacillus composti]